MPIITNNVSMKQLKFSLHHDFDNFIFRAKCQKYNMCTDRRIIVYIHVKMSTQTYFRINHIYVVPSQSWGDRSDTKHSKCLLLGGRRLNQLTLIPKPKGSGGARAATAQVGPANKRNDTKRCLPVEASLRPGEAVPW